ncbi:MAG: hypothetical protein PWQ20_1279 [Thermotogaceae bacterium]|nr:hypothetical protein [Thermotogaceae bacterium]MDN5338209.1 hypothetical protein [Thermotogaceae bacterium]
MCINSGALPPLFLTFFKEEIKLENIGFEIMSFFEGGEITVVKSTRFVEVSGKIYRVDEISKFLNEKLLDVKVFMYDNSCEDEPLNVLLDKEENLNG